MNSRERRELRYIAKGKDSGAALASFLDRMAKPKRPNPARKIEKKAKRLAKNEETAAIREAVLTRAMFHCEGCGGRFTLSDPCQMDHWLGGGRRLQKQSAETCWALHLSCHRWRGDNKPSAEYWNGVFRGHCIKHGYTFTPHIEHAVLRPRAGAE